jgi:hypothetical protein
MKKSPVFAPAETDEVQAPGITRGPRAVRAFLHQALTWPGVSDSLKTVSQEKIPTSKGELRMYLTPYGLLLECADKKNLVPFANVANVILAE